MYKDRQGCWRVECWNEKNISNVTRNHCFYYIANFIEVFPSIFLSSVRQILNPFLFALNPLPWIEDKDIWYAEESEGRGRAWDELKTCSKQVIVIFAIRCMSFETFCYIHVPRVHPRTSVCFNLEPMRLRSQPFAPISLAEIPYAVVQIYLNNVLLC